MTCIECGGKLKTKKENYRYLACGLPNVTLAGVEVRRCGTCGNHEVVIPHIERLHEALAMAVVKHEARLSGGEVRFLRKYLGYSGVDFAALIGVSPETVSRWENKKETMGPSAERLLRMLVVHKGPMQQYPIETLAQISANARTKPIGLRPEGEGWVEQELAA
ncbi:MAG TPA: type II TA system antitoxin MqsA family protein [Actinomycetota bacterium]|nr:type II TA system antitoxin MqsA family protein [Actinomycetota bacterium]